MSLNIRNRTLLVLALVGVGASGMTAHTGWRNAREALIEQAFQKLTAVRETKADQVEDYFQSIVDHVVTLSDDTMILEAMRGFAEAFPAVVSEPAADDETSLRLYYEREVLPRLRAAGAAAVTLDQLLPADPLARLYQRRFLVSSPFETGAKHQLDDPGDGGQYSSLHAAYHPRLRRFIERFGYYDMFLIEATTGRVVYSVYKEVDFATSLDRGPYHDTNLAEAFRAARDAGNRDFVRLVDYEAYAPSYGARASFIASPIFDGDELLGVLAFQMPIDRINDVMTSKGEWSDVGLGASGECYIVGEDFTLRNESRFLIEDRERYLDELRETGLSSATIQTIEALGSAIGIQKVRTEGAAAARAGEVGRAIFPDYRGVRVLSAYKPLSLPDVDWVVLSELDEAEALEPARRLRNRILLEQMVILIVVFGIAFAFARSLTRPIERLSRTAGRFAAGHLDASVETSRTDEIGDLARSLDEMRRSLDELVRHQAEAIDALSTPLIPLQDDVVVMPLVGEMDERRLDKVRDALVEGLHARGARAAILDLTGLPTLDETVAGGLVRAARAARLLGAHVVVTGMQAETAKTLVSLDLRLEGIQTERSLQDGIAAVLQSTKS
jgi:anti-anti-sigma regulatory factor/HAMP domain-containing protein